MLSIIFQSLESLLQHLLLGLNTALLSVQHHLLSQESLELLAQLGLIISISFMLFFGLLHLIKLGLPLYIKL